MSPELSIVSLQAAELSAFLTQLAAGKPRESEITRKVYQWALELDGSNAAAWNGLGRCHLVSKNWEDARHCFTQAQILDNENPRSCVNLAIACDHAGDLAEAWQWAWKALSRDPSLIDAHLAEFSIFERLGMHDAMQEIAEAGLLIEPTNPDLLFGRGILALKFGDLEQGWKDFESRPTKLQVAAQMDEYPEWDGGPLKGKTIMVCREQGLGDEIMFSRYLPVLDWLGAKVVIFEYPELALLIALAFPFAKVITTDVQANQVRVDCWVAMGSLPFKCQRWEQRAPHEAYLGANPGLFESIIPQTGHLRVGLAWKGNPKHARDEFRSMSFDTLRPLLDVRGVDFYSLQMGDTESGLMNLRDYCHDWLDLAGVISNLDLVISVDTGIAHLAAAVGKPTWVLLSTLSDWRWGISGAETAWYQSMRLFRQEEPGDWKDALKRIRFDLNSQTRPCGPQVVSGPETPDCSKPSAWISTGPCRYGLMSWPTNDHYIGRSLDLYGEYSESEAELLRKVLKPGDTVIEAGANVGGLTVAMTQAVERCGRVWAFEPQPLYFRLLEANCWAACFNMALGADCRTITLRAVDEADQRIMAPSWERDREGPDFQVEQITIDSLELESCALIKIDVDGQELEILQGAESTIAQYRPILYVENDKPDRYPDLIPWLDRHGYRMYQHSAPLFNQDNFRWNPVNVFASLISAMLLCVPTENKELHPGEWGLNRVRVARKES